MYNSAVCRIQTTKVEQKKDSIVPVKITINELPSITKEASIQYGKNTDWRVLHQGTKPNQFIKYPYLQ